MPGVVEEHVSGNVQVPQELLQLSVPQPLVAGQAGFGEQLQTPFPEGFTHFCPFQQIVGEGQTQVP
jgi:hypothetical protein